MSGTIEPNNNEIVFFALGKPRTVRQVDSKHWECEGIRFRAESRFAVMEARIHLFEKLSGGMRGLPRTPVSDVFKPLVLKCP